MCHRTYKIKLTHTEAPEKLARQFNMLKIQTITTVLYYAYSAWPDVTLIRNTALVLEHTVITEW